MTVVAGIVALDVIDRLAESRDIVVARIACAENLQMVDSRDGRERDRRVAVLANIRSAEMRGVFSRRADAIVAADASTRDVRMIE
jgi:hypothetical protein